MSDDVKFVAECAYSWDDDCECTCSENEGHKGPLYAAQYGLLLAPSRLAVLAEAIRTGSIPCHAAECDSYALHIVESEIGVEHLCHHHAVDRLVCLHDLRIKHKYTCYDRGAS